MKLRLLSATMAAIFLIQGTADGAQDVALKGARQYGDAARGKEIVEMWCVGCHAAGPTVDDRIPSLRALSDQYVRTEGSVRTFLMHPHRPMPPLELGTQQIEDILAFLRTLSPHAPAK